MPEKRIKGQETFINLLGNGDLLEDQWRAIADFTFTSDLEVLDEGYLGETTNRKDSVYNGTSFSATVHMRSNDEDRIRVAIEDKARRRDGAIGRFDITILQSFPSGIQRLVTLADVEFGAIETNVSGRAEFTTMSFEGQCSETTAEDL